MIDNVWFGKYLVVHEDSLNSYVKLDNKVVKYFRNKESAWMEAERWAYDAQVKELYR